MSTRTYQTLLLLALLLAGCAAPTEAVPQDMLVLINGTLIDGTGADPIPNAVLVIQGERIVAAGSRKQIKIPRGAKTIDLQGATLLPGLINAHVHLGFSEANLQAWAYAGVTTVRDEGTTRSRTPEELAKWRDESNQDAGHARLVSAGYMMTVPSGYGDFFVTSPADAREKVFEELDAGLDLIKISLEDGYAGRSGLPKLNEAELAAIVAAAHERGALVSGHITQTQYLKILVAAGVDDIAHIPYDETPMEIWEQMVARDIYLTPTFTVLRNYGASLDICVLNLQNFLKAGGHVALGNDYSPGPGEFEMGIPMYEIEQMSRAGMTPMQIITASTRNGAIVSGMDDRVGTLEAGKIADILIVAGDPLADLQNLLEVRMVIHNGTIIRNENDREKME